MLTHLFHFGFFNLRSHLLAKIFPKVRVSFSCLSLSSFYMSQSNHNPLLKILFYKVSQSCNVLSNSVGFFFLRFLSWNIEECMPEQSCLVNQLKIQKILAPWWRWKLHQLGKLQVNQGHLYLQALPYCLISAELLMRNSLILVDGLIIPKSGMNSQENYLKTDFQIYC